MHCCNLICSRHFVHCTTLHCKPWSLQVLTLSWYDTSLFLSFERSTLNVMGRKFIAKLCKSRPQNSKNLSFPIPVGFCMHAGSLADLSSAAVAFAALRTKTSPCVSSQPLLQTDLWLDGSSVYMCAWGKLSSDSQGGSCHEGLSPVLLFAESDHLFSLHIIVCESPSHTCTSK